MTTLPALIDKMETEFAKTLPPDVPSKRFTRIARTAVQSNPDLANAERTSLLSAITQAAQDGLVIDGKEAAIVMFKGKAQYMPMVSGLVKKMRQHSEFASISHGVVYQREIDEGRFEYVKGDTEYLKHEPFTLGEEKGDPVGAYAVLTTKSGEKFRAVMDIEAINKRLAKGNNSPAKREWREEFIIKTVLKHLYKIAPNSGDEAGVLDGVFGDEREPEPVNVTPQPEPTPPEEHDEDGVVHEPKQTRAAAAVMSQVEDAEIIPDDDEIPM